MNTDFFPIETLQRILTKAQVEIVRTVLYFDVFHYPLTAGELFENSAVNISAEEFNEALQQLISNSMLIRSGEFILGPSATHPDIQKRLAGNEGAADVMPTAYAYSKRIAGFPFVEGVCLSGALSKNYYDENGDIDYFIIAKPGRLWLCRTFLIIRYKLLPKHLKKYWCVNYFVSSDHLEITDANAFTATELAYLIPAVNYGLYQDLLRHNGWYKQRFPNKQESRGIHCTDAPRSFSKSIIEKIFSGFLGRWSDDLLLRLTLKHWRKKYPSMAEEDFDLQFRSRKHVCKRHTHGFQNKVLSAWEAQLRNFEQQFDIPLQP